MDNPPSRDPAVSATTIRDDGIDICFINKAGWVSLGNSRDYGSQVPAPSTRPALPSRSPTDAATGVGENSASTSVAGQSHGTSTHENQDQTSVTPTANNSIQSRASEKSFQRSVGVSETSIIPEKILLLEELKCHLAQKPAPKPNDSYFTLIWLDPFYEVKAAPMSKGNDQPESKSNMQAESAGSDQPAPPATKQNVEESLKMDDRYVQVLDSLGLCHHCKEQTKDILWRNIKEYESRYESRCRKCEDHDGVCFLQFHTMQAPYLNKSNFILVLVHHVKIQKKPPGRYTDPEEHTFAFVLGLKAKNIGKLIKSLRSYWEATRPGSNEEVGLTTRLFLAAVLKIYGFREAQESVLKSFGKLEDVGKELKVLRQTLELEVKSNKKRGEEAQLLTAEGKKEKFAEDEEKTSKGKFEEQMQHCTTLNLKLMKLDKALPGVRSRVHFVSLCAQGLLRDQSQIQEYIRDYFSALDDKKAKGMAPSTVSERQPTHCDNQAPGTSQIDAMGTVAKQGEPSTVTVCEEQPTSSGDPAPEPAETLETGLTETGPNQRKATDQVIRALSSLCYKRRDDDKLDMLHRSMQQFEIDIKSLKARTNIAIGLVATEYARSQGSFQSLVIETTERDGSIMRAIATLTVSLLPATFLALFFTTPMIQWGKPVVKLASNTPDSLWDEGKPIFVLFPVCLWLGLSAFIGFFLWLWLHAKREQMKFLPWLIEKVMPYRPTQRVAGPRKAGYPEQEPVSSPTLTRKYIRFLNRKEPSKSILLETGVQKEKEISHSATPPTGVEREHSGLQLPVMSGGRMSGDSTLAPESVSDGGERIELEPIRQA